MTRPFVADLAPDIDSVWHWFKFQSDLIVQERAVVFRLFEQNVRGGFSKSDHAQFVGLLREEVDVFFEAQKEHLELLAMFDILATTEAIVRNDFKARIAGSNMSGLAGRYRQLQSSKPDKVRFREEILEVMKSEGVPTSIVGAVRGALNLRDWLAHGRHFSPRLGQRYTPGDVFDIARDLIGSIPP